MCGFGDFELFLSMDASLMLVNVTDDAMAKTLELVMGAGEALERKDVRDQAQKALDANDMKAVAELVSAQCDALLAKCDESDIEATFSFAFGSLVASQRAAATPMIEALARTVAGACAADDDAAALASGPPAAALEVASADASAMPFAAGFKREVRMRLLVTLHNLLLDIAKNLDPGNRDKFTQKITSFRQNVRGFLTRGAATGGSS